MAVGRTHLSFPVQEEGVKSSKHSRRGHSPNKDLHRHGHDCGHLVGKNDGEQRGQHPHGHLQFPPRRRAWRRILEPAEAAEQQHQIYVREGHKADCRRVSVGPIDGHARVEREEEETQRREPPEAAALAKAHLGLLGAGARSAAAEQSLPLLLR